MLNLITVVAAMIVSAECTGETDKRTTMYERRRGVDDLAFSNNLILGTSARTRGECGARCQANQNCATFTFIPSSHTCRKHKCFSTSGPSLHSPGAATFILRRLPSELRNLALGKPTRQSTSSAYYHSPDLAVDGNLDPNHFHGSCSHTGQSDVTPYWRVDLEKTVEVHAVIITNRGDCSSECADRLRDFDVEIFTQDPVDNPTAEAALCYHYTGSMPPGVTETLYCPIPYCGRYVRIRKSSANLSLCEVQVLGTN